VLLGLGGLTTEPVDSGAEEGFAIGVEVICVDAVNNGVDEVNNVICVVVVDDEEPFDVSIRVVAVLKLIRFHTCMLPTKSYT